ncbi:hypothetical protein HOY82DRAFT_547299 [Tuber indicum]|nr:hypothetical protein HOY82DRAFT_547299 [Tuber indicum]
MISVPLTPGSLTLMNLIPIGRPSTRNPMLVQQVSRNIIRPLDPTISNMSTSLNWAIHMVTMVLCEVVSVEGLLCLETSTPGAIWGLAGKSTSGASMRAATGGAGALLVLAEDAQGVSTGIPGSIRGSYGGVDVILWVYFAYPVGGLDVIGGTSTIP